MTVQCKAVYLYGDDMESVFKQADQRQEYLIRDAQTRNQHERRSCLIS